MKAKFCSLFACFVLLLPALLPAQGNNVVTVVADGRQESDSIPPNIGNTYVFQSQPGHSYSVEQSRGLNRPTVPMFVASGCQGNPPMDTSTMVPAVVLNIGFPPQRQRISFACGGPVFPNNQQNFASVMIQNFGNPPAAYNFNLIVTETTLFAGKWKATSNADTFWTFTNTSSATVNVTLTLLDPFGNQMNPAPFMPINPGATFSIDTTQLPLPPRNPPPPPPMSSSFGGSVLVSQDGPPNAIKATEVIVTNNGGPCPGPTCVTTSETVTLEPKAPIQ